MPYHETPIAPLLDVRTFAAGPGLFILGTSTLNSAAKLGSAQTVLNLQSDAVDNITITRTVGEAGNAQITLKDLSTPLRIGERIIFARRIGATLYTVFTGIIRTWEREHDEGHTYTTITATDIGTELSNQTRYGASSGTDTPDTWAQRITRLIESVPDLPTDLSLVGGTTYPAADAVYETSIASWLTTMTNSSPTAVWFIDRQGRITVRANPGTTPAATFAHYDNSFVVPYVAYTRQVSSEDVINELTLTNHAREQGDDGQWVALDTETVTEDITSRATYGASSAGKDICVHDPAHIAALATALIAKTKNPDTGVDSIRVNLAGVPAAHLPGLLTTDLTNAVTVYTPDADPETRRIKTIQHTITAHRWMLTLELQGA